MEHDDLGKDDFDASGGRERRGRPGTGAQGCRHARWAAADVPHTQTRSSHPRLVAVLLGQSGGTAFVASQFDFHHEYSKSTDDITLLDWVDRGGNFAKE